MANKQKAGRKFGRNRDRNPASKAYTLGKRWLTNKAKRIARHHLHNPKADPSASAPVPADYTPRNRNANATLAEVGGAA